MSTKTCEHAIRRRRASNAIQRRSAPRSTDKTNTTTTYHGRENEMILLLFDANEIDNNIREPVANGMTGTHRDFRRNKNAT